MLIEQVGRALDAFVARWSAVIDFGASEEWRDRPGADASKNRIAWSNRCVSLQGAGRVLEIGAGDGVVAAAALSCAPGIQYVGIAPGAAVLGCAVLDALTEMHPGRVEARAGDVGQAFSALWRGRVTPFDWIRIDGAPDKLGARYFLLEALRLCAPGGAILVERCDLLHVNAVVVEFLAAGAAHVAEVPGWTHHPAQTLLRAGKRTTGREEDRPEEDRQAEPGRIILVAVSGKGVQREWAVSRPGVVSYAARVGAFLVEFTDVLAPPMSLLAKMVALDRVGRPGRVLLLDTDIVIREDAPDLFEMVPLDAVGVFLESLVADRSEFLKPVLSYYGCEAGEPYYANTGVLLLPEGLVRQFTLSALAEVLYVDVWYEQGYFNALLRRLGLPIFNISLLFNCMPALTPCWCDQAYFIHFAGGSLGLRHGKIWEEVQEPVSGCTLLVQRDFSGKEMRHFDIRNALRDAAGPYDRLISAGHLFCADGLLVLREGVPVLRLPPSDGMLIWGGYLDLDAGSYELTVLLEAAAFGEAFLAGIAPPPGLSLPMDAMPPHVPATIALDLACCNGAELLIERREVVVAAGRATVSFTLRGKTAAVECRLFGRGERLDFYGLRFRRVGPAPQSGSAALT